MPLNPEILPQMPAAAPSPEPPTCNLQSPAAGSQPVTSDPHADPDPGTNGKGQSETVTPHYRRGTIARLPKEVRRRVNEMLDDGLPYLEIIRRLADSGKDLNEDMLHRWKMGGYQDYLREQRLLDQCSARRERAFALLSQSSHINGFQATQQIAASQICEVVADLGSDILREALVANPLNYFRMLNSFARLTNGGLKCERHQIDEADRQARLKKESEPRKLGLSVETRRQLERDLNLM